MSTDEKNNTHAERRATLTQGEAAKLAMYLFNNIEELRGQGYVAAASRANANLPFDVTDTNVRNLCKSEDLPELAIIHPKAALAREALELESLDDRVSLLEQRMGDDPVLPAELTPQIERLFERVGVVETKVEEDQYPSRMLYERIQKFENQVREINGLQQAQSDTIAKLGQVAGAIAPRIDGLEQSQQGIASGLQCLKELIHVLDRDLDVKSWASRWRDSAAESQEGLALDGGVCGND